MKSILAPKNRTATQKTWSKNGTRRTLAHLNETFSNDGYPTLPIDQRAANTRGIKASKYKEFMDQIPMTSCRMRTSKFNSFRIKSGDGTLPNVAAAFSPMNDMKKMGRGKMPGGLRIAAKTTKNTPASSPKAEDR